MDSSEWKTLDEIGVKITETLQILESTSCLLVSLDDWKKIKDNVFQAKSKIIDLKKQIITKVQNELGHQQSQ